MDIDPAVVRILVTYIEHTPDEPFTSSRLVARASAVTPTLVAVMQGRLDDEIAQHTQQLDKVRGYAATMLGEIKDPDTIEPMLAAFRDHPDGAAHDYSMHEALADMGPAALEPLLREFAQGVSNEHRALIGFAAVQLGVRDERLLIMLIEMVELDLYWAASSFAAYGDPRGAAVLREALEHRYDPDADDSASSYEAIVSALDKLGAPLTARERERYHLLYFERLNPAELEEAMKQYDAEQQE